MENPFTIIEVKLTRIERILQLLLEKNDEQEKTNDSDIINGIELAMRLTGKSRQTIYQLVSKRKIPHFRKSGKLYFSKNELIDWIKSGAVPTIEQLKKSADQILNKCSFEKHSD